MEIYPQAAPEPRWVLFTALAAAGGSKGATNSSGDSKDEGSKRRGNRSRCVGTRDP